MKPVRLLGAGVLALVLALLSTGAAPVANAAPQKQVNTTLAALWTKVLETPSAQNSFGSGGHAFECWDLDGTIAPLHPIGADSCTVKPGTKIFLVGYTVECSTFEGNGTTEEQLRSCARELNAIRPTVTLDGRSVAVTEAVTPLLHITLPANNLFGLPAGTQGLSVGHGWVVPLHPLTPGTHAIVIRTGTLDAVTTTIIVDPHSR